MSYFDVRHGDSLRNSPAQGIYRELRTAPPFTPPAWRRFARDVREGGSNAVGELLAWLYLHPEKEYSTTDLAAWTGTSQSTVSREADRFAAAGL
ncbi:hypothetical protein [Nonomuraea sp. NPDC049028]|uniref:hypothetical protein n=1 Tax=Nonomuraea sp. NPDC049028 TaxID=3364348 RepID=UPI003714D6E1